MLDRLLPALLTEMMRHVDVAELLQENVDVVALAEEVIAEIDLPEIIRDSTGAMASDTLLGVRMHSISGDDAIARAVDRLRLRLTRGAVGPGAAEPVPAPGETVVVASPRYGSTGQDPLMDGISPVPREARPFQGQRAGLVTRLVANTVDALSVSVVLLASYAGFNALLFLISPRNFEFATASGS